MIARADIVAEAKSWVDTRWRHQAYRKGVGCDCIGLVAGVALALGIQGAAEWMNDARSRGYTRRPNPVMLMAAVGDYLERVHGAPLLGDILLMTWHEQPQHFAIVSKVDPLYIIHAYAQARRVVEHGMTGEWPSRVLAVYRYRGVA